MTTPYQGRRAQLWGCEVSRDRRDGGEIPFKARGNRKAQEISARECRDPASSSIFEVPRTGARFLRTGSWFRELMKVACSGEVSVDEAYSC